MTKQHFQMIADVLSDYDHVEDSAAEHERREQLAYRFAEQLEDYNPRFDRDRFLRACGVER